MKGVPAEPRLREGFQERFDAILAIDPPEWHPFPDEVFDLCYDIDYKMSACHAHLRDCNVIFARTNDRMARFLAMEACNG